MSGLLAGNTGTSNNCFYLDGIEGTTGILPRTGETLFYKTSDNTEDMTTAKVVAQLNGYIETSGYAETDEDKVDTTGWCKWIISDENLPILDFNTEWNGTEWETVSN